MDQLNSLLNEFYCTTSNERKREIEVQLKLFQNTAECLELSLHILPNINNQYLWFFSIQNLELVITKKWLTLPQNQRHRIREFVWQVYVQFPLNIGNLQREKTAQIIALIGKREFPEEHAEFVNQIIELIKSKFILGITLLKATSQEIVSTKPDVNSHQKKHFLNCMNVCLSQILTTLSKFLTLCVYRIQNKELTDEDSINLNLSLPNDNRFSYSSSELLSCVNLLFTWSSGNLENLLSSEFLNNIFDLCVYNQSYSDINIAALSAISELFYLQKKIPLKNHIAYGITELLQQPNLLDFNEQYQDKFTELLRLFTSQQWKICVSDNCFPTKDFILYLFNYTFSGISLTFIERLMIWVPIIKSFKDKSIGRYTETTIQLISNIHKKMQFKFDQNELECLDTEELDENMETELQHFINQCLDIIDISSEVEPIKVFDFFFIELDKEFGDFKIFISLLELLPNYSPSSTKSFNCLDEILHRLTAPSTKCVYLYNLIKDLSTLIQVITRICCVVSNNANESRNDSITFIIKSMLFMVKLSNTKKVYLYSTENIQIINATIDLHSQLLSSLRSLILLRNEISNNSEEMFELINSIAELLVPVDTECQEPVLIQQSAAQLMLTITSEIRPNYFLKIPKILQLMQSDLKNADKTVQSSLKRVFFNSLILPYNGIATNNKIEQHYEKRCAVLLQYVEFTSKEFLSIDNDTQIISENLKLLIKNDLNAFENLLVCYENTHSITRQMLLNSIKSIIDKSINIFSTFGKMNNEIFEAILNFFLSVIKVLQIQLGSQFVIQVIKMFLETAMGNHLNSYSICTMEKLLKMLIFIVQESATTSNLLMPDILNLSLEFVLPLVFQFDQKNIVDTDIAVTLFNLFDSILQFRWNYFQKPQANQPTNNLQEEQLLKIFSAYGRILVSASQYDPTIIRIILNSLEKLNLSNKLYEKDFFKHRFLKSFLCTFIRLIISPESTLYYELLVVALFNMSSTSKSFLFEAFIEVGYPQNSKIIHQVCEVTDSPTFCSYLDQIIQDTRFSQFLQ